MCCVGPPPCRWPRQSDLTRQTGCVLHPDGDQLRDCDHWRTYRRNTTDADHGASAFPWGTIGSSGVVRDAQLLRTSVRSVRIVASAPRRCACGIRLRGAPHGVCPRGLVCPIPTLLAIGELPYLPLCGTCRRYVLSRALESSALLSQALPPSFALLLCLVWSV